MSESMFYMTLQIEQQILNHNDCFYIDNLYSAVSDITKDYLKSDEYKKDESLLASINDYIKNNRRLILYIMNREQVKDDEII